MKLDSKNLKFMIWKYMVVHGINNLIFIEEIMNKTYYLNILKD